MTYFFSPNYSPWLPSCGFPSSFNGVVNIETILQLKIEAYQKYVRA